MEKATTTAPNKDNVVINMLLAITTHSQIPKNVVFKEKKPLKNKSLVDQQKGEKLQCSFEETINDIQEKEPHGASTQTLVKANLTKNFDLDPKNQLTRPTDFAGSIGSIDVTRNTKPTEFLLI
jgi:hypothetical protein